MNADIGSFASLEENEWVMRSEEGNFFWIEQMKDGVQQIVGCVRNFNDKSQILLSLDQQSSTHYNLCI